MSLSVSATPPASTLPVIDWDDVLETLDGQRCVLFLGSSVYQAPGGGPLDAALATWLDAGNPDHAHIRACDPDGFFLFRKSRYSRKVVSEMARFYNQAFPETEIQLARLAQMPFSMVFTLTPDNLLPRTFDVLGFDYQPDFYFRGRPATEQFERPTKHKPLLYNLLGNIEEPESLVLTHGDFFEYLQSVFIGNSLHVRLQEELEKAERYIFLGLPYEKWYFQILLRVLSLHSEKLKEVERLALKEFENPHLHTLYTEEFKLEFFPGDGDGLASPEWFINELYRRCEASGRLKQPVPPDPAEAALPDPTPAALRELVGQAETEKALLHLKVFLRRRKPRSHRLANDLVVLSNRHHLLRQRDLRGTIDSRDLAVENNQIVERLLDLIQAAENL